MKKCFFVIYSSLLLCVSGYASCHLLANVGTQQEQQLKDGQILNIIMTIDKGEIDASKEALMKKGNSEVSHYASYLIKQHQENLDEATALGKQLGIMPEESTIATDLKSHSKESHQKLVKLQSNEFDKAYIDAMVKDHQEGLNLIDSKLLQQTKNPQLKAFVEKTRYAVSEHLEKARQIQKTL